MSCTSECMRASLRLSVPIHLSFASQRQSVKDAGPLQSMSMKLSVVLSSIMHACNAICEFESFRPSQQHVLW